MLDGKIKHTTNIHFAQKPQSHMQEKWNKGKTSKNSYSSKTEIYFFLMLSKMQASIKNTCQLAKQAKIW